jgi:hypothetical protein
VPLCCTEGVEVEVRPFLNNNSHWRGWGGYLYVSVAVIRVKEIQYFDESRPWSAGSGEKQTPVDIQSDTVIKNHKFRSQVAIVPTIVMVVLTILFLSQCIYILYISSFSLPPFIFLTPSPLLPYCIPIACTCPSMSPSYLPLLHVKKPPSLPLSFPHPSCATHPFSPFWRIPFPSLLFMFPLSVSCQSVIGTCCYLFVDVWDVLLAIKTSKFLIRVILFVSFLLVVIDGSWIYGVNMQALCNHCTACTSLDLIRQGC